MLNTQKQIKTMGAGNAGQIVKGLHNYCILFHGSAKDDSVSVGCFIQATDTEGIIKGASNKAIDNKILGIAIKDQYINANDNTTNYKANDLVTYLTKGVVYIETKTPAKEGQNVFLKTDDGTLVFDNAETKTGHTFTGFKVKKGTSATIDAQTGFEIIAIIA